MDELGNPLLVRVTQKPPETGCEPLRTSTSTFGVLGHKQVLHVPSDSCSWEHLARPRGLRSSHTRSGLRIVSVLRRRTKGWHPLAAQPFFKEVG